MKKRLLSVVLRMAEYEVEKSNNGWPPCAGFIYQPRRPSISKKECNNVKEKNEI